MEGGDVMRRWMREGSLRRYGGAGHPKKKELQESVKNWERRGRRCSYDDGRGNRTLASFKFRLRRGPSRFDMKVGNKAAPKA